MRRRTFIRLFAGAAAAWQLPVHAQQTMMPVVGFLGTYTRQKTVQAFRQGLSETGYMDGQNVRIEFRNADGRYSQLPALAEELIRLPLSVLVAGGVPATLAAKGSKTVIPVVFYMGADPVELGVVDSLNRPGGTFTGVTLLNTELVPKRLELLQSLVPAVTRFAFLVNPTNRNAENQWRDMQAAARTLNLQLHLLRASSERDFDAAFASIAQLGAGGLVIGADGVFVAHSEQLAALSVRHAVPTIFQFSEFAEAGGLASYGGSSTDGYRQVGVYAGRILKGEKPAELAVQQSSKVEMVINLKSAKALGITVPLPLLGRADEVIE